jgi:hypothetical protein
MKPSPESFNGGGRQNRFVLQCFALILMLTLPFALYAALQGGNIWLGVLFFSLLMAAMALTLISG